MNIVANGNLPGFSLETLIGQSVAILGITGSGKSNTAAVIIEELFGHIPLIIVDIESEYWSLRESFEILIAGKSENVDLNVDSSQAESLANFVVGNNMSIVLDVSEYDEIEREEFLTSFFKTLWKIVFRTRKPYQIILEEAHEFIPQGVKSKLKSVLTQIALRGRKRGLGIICASQRSAKVEKDVLTQANVAFLHSVKHPIDIKVYQDIIPLPPKQVENMIFELGPGRAIIMYGQQIHSMNIRKRHTFHVGYTPGLSADTPPLKTIDASLLKKLSEALTSSNSDDLTDGNTLRNSDATTLKLQDQLRKQRQEFSERESALLKEIESLKKQLQKVPKIQVDKTHEVQLLSKEQAEEKDNDRVPFVPYAVPKNGNITKSGIAQQERHFNALLKDISRLPKLHRSMLRFLIERDSIEFNITELSRYMGKATNTLLNQPPLLLLNRGLIVRKGKGQSSVYKAYMRTFLSDRFPDLDTETLLSFMIKNLPES